VAEKSADEIVTEANAAAHDASAVHVHGASESGGTPLEIDMNLVAGAAVFGAGWGLSGFCPGPALVSFGTGAPAALVFVPAMIAGMAAHRFLLPGVVAQPGTC